MPQKRLAEAKATTTRRQRRVCFLCVVCDRVCGVDTIQCSQYACWGGKVLLIRRTGPHHPTDSKNASRARNSGDSTSDTSRMLAWAYH